MDVLFEHDELSKEYLEAPWGEWGRSLTLGVVSMVGKCVLHVMNRSEFDRVEVLKDAVMDRERDLGLITVSNHTSTLDDPMLFSAMFPLSFFFSEHRHRRVRWSICAREVCYSNTVLGQFFKSGKTLPIERGAGLHQPVMQVVAKSVARGDWVHVFPEGKVHYNEKLGPLKWGVGKLFCDAFLLSGRMPMVVPFHHVGMSKVLPKGSRVPRMGHHVKVRVGDPIDLSDVVDLCKSSTREGQECAWKEITHRIGNSLKDLENSG